jgi:hypothetical protein
VNGEWYEVYKPQSADPIQSDTKYPMAARWKRYSFIKYLANLCGCIHNMLALILAEDVHYID